MTGSFLIADAAASLYRSAQFRFSGDTQTPVPAQSFPGRQQYRGRKVVCASAAVLLVSCVLISSPQALAGAEPAGIKLRMSDRLGAAQAPAATAGQRDQPGWLHRFAPRVSGLKLEMTLGARHDDNVLRTETSRRSSMIAVAKPKVVMAGRVGRHGFELGYDGDYGRYLDEANENYTDHEFIGDAELRLTRRLRVLLDNGLEFGHDRRGDVGSRLVGAAEPDRWRHHHAGGEVIFGRASAKVLRTRAEVAGSYEVSGIRYQNNNQSGRDYDVRDIGLRGRYNVGSRLSLVTDAGLTFIDYLDPSVPLDSREASILVGVAWEATAKTSGEVKVGRFQRDFFDPSQQDSSGIDWDARVQWTPKTYSVLSLYALRDSVESGQGGGSAVVDKFGGRWVHGLTKKLTLEGFGQLTQSDFGSARSDDLVDLEAALSYQLSRWATVRGGLEHSFRDSTAAGADFDNSVVFLEFVARFDRRTGRNLERN